MIFMDSVIRLTSLRFYWWQVP